MLSRLGRFISRRNLPDGRFISRRNWPDGRDIFIYLLWMCVPQDWTISAGDFPKGRAILPAYFAGTTGQPERTRRGQSCGPPRAHPVFRKISKEIRNAGRSASLDEICRNAASAEGPCRCVGPCAKTSREYHRKTSLTSPENIPGISPGSPENIPTPGRRKNQDRRKIYNRDARVAGK